MAGRFGAVQSGQRKSLVFAAIPADIGRLSSPRRPCPPPMQDPSFRRAQQQYARIRETAYAIAREDAIITGSVRVPLRLAQGTPYAISVWRTMWTGSHPTGWGGWDWESLFRHAWKDPSAFHLSIWSGPALCGLAVGRASRRTAGGVRKFVAVEYIESAHDRHHPLRGSVASLTTSAAHAYGRLLSAEWVRLINPLPGVIGLYGSLGYELVTPESGVLYCERRIVS